MQVRVPHAKAGPSTQIKEKLMEDRSAILLEIDRYQRMGYGRNTYCVEPDMPLNDLKFVLMRLKREASKRAERDSDESYEQDKDQLQTKASEVLFEVSKMLELKLSRDGAHFLTTMLRKVYEKTSPTEKMLAEIKSTLDKCDETERARSKPTDSDDTQTWNRSN